MRLMSASVSGKSGSLQQLPQPVQRNFRYFSPMATSRPLSKTVTWVEASLTGRDAAEIRAGVAQVFRSEREMIEIELPEPLLVDAARAQSEAPSAHTPTYIQQRVGREHHSARRVCGARRVLRERVDQRLDLGDFFGAALRAVVTINDRAMLHVVNPKATRYGEGVAAEGGPNGVVLTASGR